jgi:enoyl-CoA hydratase/carnithine racemase
MSFRYEEDRSIARITLARPAKKNALTFQVYGELTETFQALKSKPEVRAVSITGEGSGFCSGGDVDEIIGPLLSFDAPRLLGFTRMTCELVAAIRSCPQPVVAAVNGVAAGAGAAIALACDLRVVSKSARFFFLFTKVGLAGADMGAAFLLPRVVGLGRASELLLLGDAVSADQAERFGLANRVVADQDLLRETDALLERLAQGPRMGLAMTKEALNRELAFDLAAALEAEAQAQALCMGHPDFREGYRAFAEKRPLRFEGAPEPPSPPA